MPRSVRSDPAVRLVSVGCDRPRCALIRVYPRYQGIYDTSGCVLVRYLFPACIVEQALMRTRRGTLPMCHHYPLVLYDSRSRH